MSYTKIIIKKRGRTPGLVHISESKTKATLIKVPKMVKTIEKTANNTVINKISSFNIVVLCESKLRNKETVKKE